MATSDRQVEEQFAQGLRPDVDLGGVMCFSPAVQRAFPHSKAARMTTRDAPLSRTDAAKAAVPPLGLADMLKKNNGAAGAQEVPSLMQTPESATNLLNSMATEMQSARGWLREVSAGSLPSDGPYFSPCRVKNEEDLSKLRTFQTHKLYQEFVAKDQNEYQTLLAIREDRMKGDLNKQVDHLKTISRKFRQAAQELLKKREELVMRAFDEDREFGKREKAYRDQVSVLTHKNTELKAAMLSTGDAAQGIQRQLEGLLGERDELAARLEDNSAVQEACADLEAQLQESNAQRNTLAEQLSGQEAANKALGENLSALEARFAEQGEVLAEQTEKTLYLEGKVDSLTSIGAEVASAAKESEAVAEDLREQVASLKEELESDTSKDEQLEELRRELAAKELRIECLQAEMEDTSTSLAEQLRCRDEEAATSSSRIEELNQDIVDARAKLDQAATEHEELLTEKDALEERLFREAREATQRAEVAESQGDDLRVALESAQESLKAEEEDRAELQELFEKLEEVLEERDDPSHQRSRGGLDPSVRGCALSCERGQGGGGQGRERGGRGGGEGFGRGRRGAAGAA